MAARGRSLRRLSVPQERSERAPKRGADGARQEKPVPVKSVSGWQGETEKLLSGAGTKIFYEMRVAYARAGDRFNTMEYVGQSRSTNISVVTSGEPETML
jgi:hypothetical protein